LEHVVLKQPTTYDRWKIRKRVFRLKQEHYFEYDSRNAFKLYVSRTKSQVQSELAKFILRLSKLNLHPQIEYAVMSEGKRLRPLLVILSAESVGGSRDEVMPLALAFELMHTASLVHDDIIDQDEMRRGRPAVHKKWSMNDALLTGDALIALAIDLASGYGETTLKAVAQSALELCDGEDMDLTFSLKTASEEPYFRKIGKKSASLFRAAAYCGALAGGGTPSEAHSLSAFGENFGIAYQLRDDLLDLASSPSIKSIPADLKTARLTLPLIHLYETSGLREREQLESDLRFLFGRKQSSSYAAVRRVQRMLGESDSVAYCEKRIAEYVQKAIDSITPLMESNSKSYLIQMVESLIVGWD